MKRVFTILLLMIVLFAFNSCRKEHDKTFVEAADILKQKIKGASEENIIKRRERELKMLADPVTGKIPANIRSRELKFAESLPKSANNNFGNFQSIGPDNFGGRTRALAIDVTNENVMLAGGVSGGIWRTEDGGQNWTKVTSPGQLLPITSIVQDTRPGKTHLWYAGTGELLGNSASSPGGYNDYRGDGILKSEDGGITWDTLSSTFSGTPQTGDNFDFVWRVVTDPSAPDSLDVVLAAVANGIYRSENGGQSWTKVIGANQSTGWYTDIAVTSSGVFYAAVSSSTNIVNGTATVKGIFRSEDGLNWVDITPSNWLSAQLRTVIGIDPNNENTVYFLIDSWTYGGNGKVTYDFQGNPEWNSLWKYEYISGDGSGAGGNWTDLSQNIPVGPYDFDDFYTQLGYDMCVAVQPGNSNVVFIGGTNLYRSTDGFTTPDNIRLIGGYPENIYLSQYLDEPLYPNHHPDQHVILFSPSNPNVMYNCNDGGVFRTNNVLADTVQWTPLNNHYVTTQFYTIAIDHGMPDSKIVIGGLQDNGTMFTDAHLSPSWTMSMPFDGSYCAIEDGANVFYASAQNGKIAKLSLDSDGNITAFRRIDPIGGDNYDFINPFVIDPVDNNVMYLSAGTNLWRNDSLYSIALTNEWDSISQGWFKFSSTTNGNISAFGVTYTGSHTLYIGTSNGQIYKILNANTGDPQFININNGIDGAGYISSIAVDPRDDNKILVVYSNYNVHSLHYSEDGGLTWGRVGGNLEAPSAPPGYPDFLYNISDAPSCRYAKILPAGDSTIYLVGTSVGLFATYHLYPGNDRESDSTTWYQQGWETIGNAVVTMIDTREDDGFTAVATHGNGVFVSNLRAYFDITKSEELAESQIEIYPNPVKDRLFVKAPQKFNAILYDVNGKVVKNINSNDLPADVSDLKPNLYFMAVQQESRTFVYKIIKI